LLSNFLLKNQFCFSSLVHGLKIQVIYIITSGGGVHQKNGFWLKNVSRTKVLFRSVTELIPGSSIYRSFDSPCIREGTDNIYSRGCLRRLFFKIFLVKMSENKHEIIANAVIILCTVSFICVFVQVCNYKCVRIIWTAAVAENAI
jgi:hypothetical protein